MYATAVSDILNDPAASYWLKSALRALLERDPLDAIHDAEALARALQAQWNYTGGEPVAPRTMAESGYPGTFSTERQSIKGRR